MMKENYERLCMDVTEFDAEDIVTTSALYLNPDEMGIGGETNSTGFYPGTMGF